MVAALVLLRMSYLIGSSMNICSIALTLLLMVAVLFLTLKSTIRDRKRSSGLITKVNQHHMTW